MSDKKDMLEEMFSQQRLLQDRFVKEMIFEDEIDRQRYINMNLLALFNEVAEVQRETIWKSKQLPYGWKRQSVADLDKYKEEIIDCMHFLMNLWLATGCTAREFYEMYLVKCQENHKRQQDGY